MGTIRLAVALPAAVVLLLVCSACKPTYPAGEPPPNALPREASLALDLRFQELGRGDIGMLMGEDGQFDLCSVEGEDGYVFTAADGERVIVQNDLVLDGHELAAGAKLRKSGQWWVVE